MPYEDSKSSGPEERIKGGGLEENGALAAAIWNDGDSEPNLHAQTAATARREAYLMELDKKITGRFSPWSLWSLWS